MDAVWPSVLPYLERAIAKVPTELTPEFIRDKAKAETMRLWIVSRGSLPVSAFAVTEWPDKTLEFMAFSADEFGEWMPVVLPLFAAMARSAGMRALRIDGRRGWERRMTSFGFKTVGREGRTVVMDMVL